MKKLIALLMAVLICCALCACAAPEKEEVSLMDQILAEQTAARAKIFAQAHGTWKIAEARDGFPAEVVIKEDGTCTIDGKAMFWAVYNRKNMYPTEGETAYFLISVTEEEATTQFAMENYLIHEINVSYSDVNTDLVFTMDDLAYNK